MFKTITNAVSPKEKVWEGISFETYEKNCKILKDAGLYIQAFKVNQETPKCDGKCGSCMSKCGSEKEVPAYEKIGTGISDNLLNDKLAFDQYNIYVLKKDLEKAKELLK